MSSAIHISLTCLHSVVSYTYLVARLEVIPDTSSEARQAAIDAIVAALRLPIASDIHKLLGSGRLEVARDHALYSLLQILAQGTLKDYNDWESGNKNILIESGESSIFPTVLTNMRLISGLDASAVESKIRFLTLVALSSDYIGKELTYARITSALQVPESEVELWVINGNTINPLSEDAMLTIAGHS